MVELSKEQQIEICNAINTAIASGKMVMAGDIIIAGAFPNARGICAVRHYDWNDMNHVPICWIRHDIVQAFRVMDIDKEILYMPFRCDTNKHGSAAKSNDSEDCRNQSNQPDNDFA